MKTKIISLIFGFVMTTLSAGSAFAQSESSSGARGGGGFGEYEIVESPTGKTILICANGGVFEITKNIPIKTYEAICDQEYDSFTGQNE